MRPPRGRQRDVGCAFRGFSGGGCCCAAPPLAAGGVWVIVVTLQVPAVPEGADLSDGVPNIVCGRGKTSAVLASVVRVRRMAGVRGFPEVLGVPAAFDASLAAPSFAARGPTMRGPLAPQPTASTAVHTSTHTAESHWHRIHFGTQPRCRNQNELCCPLG